MSAPARPPLRPVVPDRDYSGVVELIRAVNAHDDGNWFPTIESLALDWSRSPQFDAERDARVVEATGRIVGAVVVDWRHRTDKVTHGIEVWVHPDQRRQGLGRALVEWAEARARASVAEGTGGPVDLPHYLDVGAETNHEAAMAFAAVMGFEPVRYGFVMRRSLDGEFPSAPLPDGLEIRPVTPDQHRRIWAADVEAFADHWEHAARTEEDFAAFFGHPDLDTSLWQVAWDGDEVAGSVMNGIYRDENEALGVDVGWLDHVSVRRPWRGRGLARALISRSLVIHRDRGMAFASLGVDAENPTGALALYQGLGFVEHKTWVTQRKPLATP